MADTKTTALTEESTPTSDDLVYLVNDPGGTPASRKATLANVFANVTATDATNAANVTLADESTDTTCFPIFATDATGNQAPKTDASALTYNAGTGALSATAFVGDLTGDVTGNADTVTVADAGGDTTTFPLLATSATGSLAPATDAGLTYNATTNALTATTFIGALTGNADTATSAAGWTTGRTLTVSGDASGTSSSWDGTGNATLSLTVTAGDVDTATTATNATNINLADEGTDTTCFPVFATAATGNQAPKTDASALTYNSATGALAATTFVGALSGNATTATSAAGWTTARTLTLSGDVSGTSSAWDGTGNATMTATVADDSHDHATSITGSANVAPTDESSDTSTFPLFVNAATGSQLPHTNTGLTYNSSTNALTATTFVGALTGNADTATAATNVTMGAAPSDTTMYPMLVGAATATDQAPKYDTSLVWDATNNELELDGDIVGTKTGGITIWGGDADGETLTLQGNSVDFDDYISALSPIRRAQGDHTFSDGDALWDGFLIGSDPDATYTVTATTGGPFNLGPAIGGVVFQGTWEWDENPNGLGMSTLFANGAIHKNVTADTRAYTALTAFADNVVVEADTQTGQTMTIATSFLANPTLRRTGATAGELTLTTYRAFDSMLTVNTQQAVTTRQGFIHRAATGASRITSDLGLIVDDISGSATNSTQVLLGTTTTPSGDWAIYSDSTEASHFDGPIQFDEMSTPANPAAEDVVMYKKGDKFVWGFNDGGTMSYVSLTMTAGAAGAITDEGATPP